MKNFKIIVSKENIYTGQVKKIKEQSELFTEVINIEDLLEAAKVDFNHSIVYFLCCNSPLVHMVINQMEKYDCYIINKEYLLKKYLKLEVQKLLSNNKVMTPTIFSNEKIEEIKFPVFCKENRHEGIIAQIYNELTINRLFSKFDKKDFYIEQSINDNISKEIKVYYVAGKLFFQNEVKDKEHFCEVCKNISNTLDHLEVFSADIIQTEDGKLYVIDVNPSAGFYLSDEGRKYFLEEIKKR